MIMSASMGESGQLIRIMNNTTRLRLTVNILLEIYRSSSSCRHGTGTLGFVETCASSPNVGSMCKIRRMRSVHVPAGDLGSLLAQSWKGLMGYSAATQPHLRSEW